MPVDEASNDAGQAAVRGTNSAGGDGIVGRGRRGVVGESDDYQGVYGRSGTNAGVVGESAQFHAVYAVSHGANNAGVAAFNDAGGTGVWGKGRRGVVGESDDYQGVYGTSGTNAGVVGEAARFHGIFGVSHGVNNAGVLGTNDAAGYGVIAISEQGVGISAKGGKLAGRFEGIVEVTGAVVVAGVDVTSRIRALEKELAALKERVRVLEGRAGGSSGGGATATASIQVELRHTGGAFDELRVSGNGFSPNENIEISLESKAAGGQNTGTSTAQAKADPAGRFSQAVSVSCPKGVQTTHTARARGLSSGNLSNTAGASC